MVWCSYETDTTVSDINRLTAVADPVYLFSLPKLRARGTPSRPELVRVLGVSVCSDQGTIHAQDRDAGRDRLAQAREPLALPSESPFTLLR